MALQQPYSLILAAAILLTELVIYIPSTEASVVSIRSRNPPRLILRVGAGGNNISVVDFPVTAAQIGDGSPITGTPRIRMDMRIRATPPFSRVATLTVDSSTPLANGPATLPMSNISWAAQQGDIPGGVFNDTISQFIVSYPNSFRIRDWHTFSYANTQILEPGTYAGRVTYTLAMP